MSLKLKSSARTNKRYLLIRARREDIEKSLLEYTGILGLSNSNLTFVEDNKEKVIISIDRKSLNDVLAGFEIYKIKIEVLRVSGTIKGLSK